MKKLTDKIMHLNFKKLWIRFLVICLCAALVGGGVSALLLRPQIGEAVSVLRLEEEDQEGQAGEDRAPDGKRAEGEKRDAFEKRLKHLPISEPSRAAKAAVGSTAAAALVLAAAYWLLTAAWVYRLAREADMNGLLWFLLTLAGNLGAAVLFFVLRSFLRCACPVCGAYQRKGVFCRRCGEPMEQCCPQCGGKTGLHDRFCPTCGNKLEQ